MIKSYEFHEYLPDGDSLRDPAHFSKELEIAKTAVKNIKQSKKPPCDCIVCGNPSESFFKKWNVQYLRCPDCGTIFVNIDRDSVEKYKKNKEMITLRKSERYQKDIFEKRKNSWDELHDWIFFRTFRYLGKKEGLCGIDVGNRYYQLAELLKNSKMFSEYHLADSIIVEKKLEQLSDESADILMYLDMIQQSIDPLSDIKRLSSKIKVGGLLYMSIKIGTGFDILVLKEHARLYPYEHIFMPTIKSLEQLLNEAGFEILDESTPGQMDVGYVFSKKEYIDQSHLFIKNLMNAGDTRILNDFQFFLQKSGMSSYARIVARKVH